MVPVRHALLFGGFCFALLLSACGAFVPQKLPPVGVEVTAAWSLQQSPPALAAEQVADPLRIWWQQFDDPQLGALVQQALRANTSVMGAQAALRQAQALRDVAAAGLWPTVGSSASAQAGTAGGKRTNDNFKVGVDANWVPDVFGSRHNALSASDAAAIASAFSLGDVQVQVAAEVALDYILLRAAQTRLAIAQDNLANQLETLQITQWRQQAGLVTVLEAEQARASAEQTRAQLPMLQTSIGQSTHALAVLLGQPPANLATQLATPSAIPQAANDLAQRIPAETLRHRSNVRAAEYQVLAARARVDQAQAQRWPSFSIGGNVGLSALTLGALGDSASVVSALLASVTLPLFDGGALRGQVRAQQAALDQAQQVHRAAILLALQEVEDALLALRSDRMRLGNLREAALAASNAATLARLRYRSGLVDFQTVLETQRTEYGTQDSVATASADVSADHVRLYKALGGRWATPTLTSTP